MPCKGAARSRDWHMLRGTPGGWHARKIKNHAGKMFTNEQVVLPKFRRIAIMTIG